MWLGYIFIKWNKYYVIGKVNEAELINDDGLNPLKAKIGTSNFDIVYFSKTPPAGVAHDSFGGTDLELDFIAEQAVKQIIFEEDVVEAEIIK